MTVRTFLLELAARLASRQVPLERWWTYRLVAWPDLGTETTPARLLQALSVMTQRSVTITWFAGRVGWDEPAALQYLDDLVRTGAAVVDRSLRCKLG